MVIIIHRILYYSIIPEFFIDNSDVPIPLRAVPAHSDLMLGARFGRKRHTRRKLSPACQMTIT